MPNHWRLPLFTFTIFFLRLGKLSHLSNQLCKPKTVPHSLASARVGQHVCMVRLRPPSRSTCAGEHEAGERWPSVAAAVHAGPSPCVLALRASSGFGLLGRRRKARPGEPTNTQTLLMDRITMERNNLRRHLSFLSCKETPFLYLVFAPDTSLCCLFFGYTYDTRSSYVRTMWYLLLVSSILLYIKNIHLHV